ncbi:MAG TPA: hypothetical protein VKM72_17195 [Thermoanaerobaculia bacterium]|nr:hypothetical protein [Thermoanaerobaculia bacterium]
MKTRLSASLPLLLLLAACGSMNVVHVVRKPQSAQAQPPVQAAPAEKVDGLRVQVPRPHEVIVVLHDPAGKRVLKTTTLSLPAKNEFYDLSFQGGLFSAREVTVKVHPNGALDEFKFDSKQEVDAAIQNVADATGTVTKALKENAPVTPDPVETENSQLKLQLLNEMLKANLKAIEEGRPLPFPDIFG